MNRTSAVAALSLLTSALAVQGAACDSPDGAPPPPPGPSYTYPDADSYCGGLAAAECNELLVSRCVTSAEACVEQRKQACLDDVPTRGRYRPAAADGCVAATAAAYQDAELTGAELNAVARTCAVLFGGDGETGTSCTTNLTCDLDAGLQCVVPLGTAAGTCQAPVEVAAGDDCSQADAVCAAGTFCDVSVRACIAGKREGSTCSDVQPCVETLRCTGSGGATTCQARLAPGEVCASDRECQSDLCGRIGDELVCMNSIFFGPNEPSCSAFR